MSFLEETSKNYLNIITISNCSNKMGRRFPLLEMVVKYHSVEFPALIVLN